MVDGCETLVEVKDGDDEAPEVKASVEAITAN